MILKRHLGSNAVFKLDNPICEEFQDGEKRNYKYGVVLNYDIGIDVTDLDCDIYCETLNDAITKATQWNT